MQEYFGRLRHGLERVARSAAGRVARRRAHPVRIAFAGDAQLLSRLAPDAGASADPRAALWRWLQDQALFPLAGGEVAGCLRWIDANRPQWREHWLREYPPRLRQVTVYGAAVSLADVERQRTGFAPLRDPLYSMAAQQLGFWPRWLLAGLARGDGLAEHAAFLQRWQRAVAGTPDPVAHADNLQIAFRVVSLTLGLPFVVACGCAPLAVDCLRVIAADVDHVRANPGQSYPNNHLLGELFLLAFVARVFPALQAGADRSAGVEAAWYRECERQLYADGTSFEHSVHYHEIVCQMMACWRLAARAGGAQPPAAFRHLLRRALQFQVSVNLDDDSPLQVGDGTEDSLLPLSPPGSRSTAALARLLRTWHPGAACPQVDGPSEEAAYWLLGGALPRRTAARSRPALQRFDDGGFQVMHDEDLDARLVFRTGPAPGLALNPGHMHADLLSVCLALRGRPMLVDPGTMSYRADPSLWPAGAPAWRRHFLSPEAHNGLALAGRDPLQRGAGDFPGNIHQPRPVSSAVALGPCRAGDGLTLVAGRNVGTSAYAGHRRGVLHVHGHGWLVWDFLPAAAGTAASVGWQFAPQARVQVAGEDAHEARRDGARLLLLAGGVAGSTAARGDVHPMGGWCSSRYGSVDPAWQLRHRCPPSAKAVVFALLPGARAPGALRCHLADGLLHLQVDTARERWEAWVGDGAPARVERPGLRFRGAAMWLRRRAGTVCEVRALGAAQIAVRDLDLRLDAARGGNVRVAAGARRTDQPR